MIKGIIFDLDGVIIETEALHFEAYRQAMRTFDYELTLEVYTAKLRSRGRWRGLRDILGDVSDDMIERIGDSKDKNYLSLLENKPEIEFKDAIALIKTCQERGIRIAVATASYQGKALLESYGMYDWFEHVVTAQDVTLNKPSPEIYNLCKQKLGLVDEEILVIEDSEAGIRSALAAGLDVIYIKRDESQQVDIELLESPKVRTLTELDISIL